MATGLPDHSHLSEEEKQRRNKMAQAMFGQTSVSAQTNECCSECSSDPTGYDYSYKEHCTDVACPRHTQSKNECLYGGECTHKYCERVLGAPQSKGVEGWEERFDSAFDLDNYGDSHAVQNKVKSFVTAKLVKARESERQRSFAAVRRWAEMMLKQHPDLFGDEPRQFYDEDELTASLQSYLQDLDISTHD